jgi:hypothetical protein
MARTVARRLEMVATSRINRPVPRLGPPGWLFPIPILEVRASIPSQSEILAVRLHALHSHAADGDTFTKRGFALTVIGLSARNEFVHKIAAPCRGRPTVPGITRRLVDIGVGLQMCEARVGISTQSRLKCCWIGKTSTSN